MDAQRILIITSALLAMVCIGPGLQLYQTNQTVVAVQADNTAISFERDQVLFDLEKLSFSYDTLSTENALMLAQIADQKNDIGRLVQQVKNGNWSLARAKQEAETLRGIMKGYVATIDSLNQLNLALIDENDQMRARVEEVQERNASLVERQENMEEMITAGQTLQAAEASAEGIRILSNGRQRPTTRASRLSMVRVCFAGVGVFPSAVLGKHHSFQRHRTFSRLSCSGGVHGAGLQYCRVNHAISSSRQNV